MKPEAITAFRKEQIENKHANESKKQIKSYKNNINNKYDGF